MPRRGAVALLAGLAGAGTVAADWSWLPWSGSVPSRPAGRVLVWGAGHGRTPSALADIPPATSVAVGDGIGAAVGADGSVHAFRPGSPSNLVAPAGSAVDVAVRSDPAEVVLLDASGRMHSSRVQADGTIAPSRLLAGALSGARARTVACGRSHCVSVTTSGHAIAWGSTNSHGQLGNGLVGACPDGTDPETPALMRTPPGKRIVQADAGDRHTVLVDDEGAVYGVGDDKWAQLGRSAEPWVEGNGGSSGDVEAASLIGDLPVQAAACGGQHTAVLVRDGTVFSFGYNTWGQLGHHNFCTFAPPSPMSDISLRAVAISAGDNHTCALQADGKLRCIGANESGQLGVGNLQPSIRWTRTKETGGDGRKREVVVSSVALGGNACAVIADAMSEKAEGA